MTSEVAVRRAAPAEAPGIAELWLRARLAAVPAVPAPAHSPDEVRTWFREHLLPAREVWVASVRDELVAVMVLDGESVDQLYVAPEHQGHGHGSRLLAHAQERREALSLWTFQANVRARAFYERHGFTSAGEPSSDNEEGAPALLYRWTRRAAAPRPGLPPA